MATAGPPTGTGRLHRWRGIDPPAPPHPGRNRALPHLLDLGHWRPVLRAIRGAPADKIRDTGVEVWAELQLQPARNTRVQELHLGLGVDTAPELVAGGAAGRQQQHPEAAAVGVEFNGLDTYTHVFGFGYLIQDEALKG